MRAMPESASLNEIHFKMSGSDGIDLLHRISTADLHALKPGQSTSALILTPQGKILTAFRVLKVNDAELVISVAHSVKDQLSSVLLETIDQYTFGEKFTLQKIENSPSSLPSLSDLERIRHAIPAVDHEFRPDGTTNPLEVNFQIAIADQKGCYPGQEVVEKMISVGSSPKKLAIVRAETATAAQELASRLPLALFDAGQPAAQLTSITEDGQRSIGLAIVRKTHFKKGLIFFSEDGQRFTIADESFTLDSKSENE